MRAGTVGLLLCLGCQTPAALLPPPCHEKSHEARAQRDHLIRLNERARQHPREWPHLQLPAIDGHPARTQIDELVTAWRLDAQHCRVLDAYR